MLIHCFESEGLDPGYFKGSYLLQLPIKKKKMREIWQAFGVDLDWDLRFSYALCTEDLEIFIENKLI